MSVAVVGTPASVEFFTSGVGTSYTAEAGSNRVVVFVLAHSSSSGGGTPVYTGVQPTFGGVNMTQVGSFVTCSASRYMCASMWLLKEASIPSGANTLVASWSDATDNLNEANALASIFTLSGVDQTTPVTSNNSATNNAVTTITCGNVTSTTGGLVIYGLSFNAGSSTGVTLPSGYTTALAVTAFDFSGFAATGYKTIATGGTEAPGASWTGSGGVAVLAANFQAASSGNTLIATNGNFALSGQTAVLNVKLASAFGSFTLTGQPATLIANSSQIMLANVGSFVVSGGTSISQYLIPSTNGSFTLNGEAVSLIGPATAGLKGTLTLLGVGS